MTQSERTVGRFVAAMLVGMVALKLTVRPEWSWWWVTAPYWFWFVLWGLACVGLVAWCLASAAWEVLKEGAR